MKYPITFSRQMISLEALSNLRKSVVLDPHYQRQGDVWRSEKQALFIDSVLNGFATPPLYWHSLSPESEYFDGQSRYAVIDGRQRMEAVFSFLDGQLRLSDENSMFGDPTISLEGKNISDLRLAYPWLYSSFWRTELEVVLIDTADIELIEELFSRLNEGVPLSAAEKRNRGVVLAPKVRNLASTHSFFTSALPFGNKRYRHHDLLAKFMRIEERGVAEGKIPDLKKADLDRLFNKGPCANYPRGRPRHRRGGCRVKGDTNAQLVETRALTFENWSPSRTEGRGRSMTFSTRSLGDWTTWYPCLNTTTPSSDQSEW